MFSLLSARLVKIASFDFNMNLSLAKERSLLCSVSHSSDMSENNEYVRRGRPNTIAEKKTMRVNRKKRLRKRYRKRKVQKLEKTIESAEKNLMDAEKTVTKLKCMARTFWERWR